MRLSVAIPNDLVDVSNGKFLGKTDLGDGYTRWDWQIQYPINSYNVSLNIGDYVHFSDKWGDVPLDFFVLPGSLEKAKKQFDQAKPMIEAYAKIFGDYPFEKDGYKLIEVPYSGMEHQTAVTYGNRFANGYLERDWTGVGVSLKFDFIIIHESAHEWFGNAVSAADVSDMWIQEGWTTYLEALYVERMFGYDDALKYINGYKPKVGNRQPIVTQRGIHRTPSQDQYFKGALFLHTLRSVVNDDERWWKLIRDFYQRFKYQNIMTEDVVRFFNAELRQDLTPIFDQYLRRTDLADPRAGLQREGGYRGLPLARRRTWVCDADPCRRSEAVADDSSDHRLAGDQSADAEGVIRSGHGPLLRQRGEAVNRHVRRATCGRHVQGRLSRHAGRGAAGQVIPRDGGCHPYG